MLGTRIMVWQALQRTFLPRAEAGTARTFLHLRLGHMIWIDSPMQRAYRPFVAGS